MILAILPKIFVQEKRTAEKLSTSVFVSCIDACSVVSWICGLKGEKVLFLQRNLKQVLFSKPTCYTESPLHLALTGESSCYIMKYTQKVIKWREKVTLLHLLLRQWDGREVGGAVGSGIAAGRGGSGGGRG